MPTGIPKNGINKGWFNKSIIPWNKGKICPELAVKMIGNTYGKANKGKPRDEETKAKLSIAAKNQFSNYLVRKRHSDLMKYFYIKNPDKHPNVILAKNGGISKGQKQLYRVIRTWYWSEAELNYPVRTKNGMRYCDIGIPNEKLDIEYDDIGYWHDSKLDEIRDSELKEVSWATVRIGQVVV